MVWMLGVMSACTDEEGTGGLVPPLEEAGIGLTFSSGITVSRAEGEENVLSTLEDIEKTVDYLDVFIWNMEGTTPTTLAYYERITTQGNPQGTKRLSTKKDFFTQGVPYRVDVIANATTTESVFKTYTTWEQLKDAVQEDYRIQVTGGHETGALGTSIQNIPTRFLMDGIARLQSASEGMKTAVLNNGDSNNTQLVVTLERAAAKIVVNLAAGEDIVFQKSTYMGYNLRNLPYSTSLLKEQEHTSELRKTDFLADDAEVFFDWSDRKVTVTAYVYSHTWNQGDFFDKGTRMTVNLPMKQGEASYDNSYYQIMLTKGNSFTRNTKYVVDAVISAPGGIDSAEPETLQDLRYSADEWTTTSLTIGNDHRPSYLYVNKDTVDIHNIDRDNETLSFYSSAEVAVTVDDVWYINKFGQLTRSGNIRYAKAVGDTVTTTMAALKNIIRVTPTAGLSGNIGIYTPVPLNNAIRFIELTIKHKNGTLSEKVVVRQYPLEYITNTQGWYSYRSDFGGTTYETKQSQMRMAAHWSDNRWNYYSMGPTLNTSGGISTNGSGVGHTFGSKVAVLDGGGTGKSTISYYYYQYKQQEKTSWWGNTTTKDVNSQTAVSWVENLSGLKNARMYHVRITSTSGSYKVGIPVQTLQGPTKVNGQDHYEHYTATDALNNTLVSPSFMIASQLGATLNPGSVDVAAKHCAQYVETYKDENGKVHHLTNWRLPTKAEVEIIMKFQYVENAAMDEVLSGHHYWSAIGPIENKKAANKDGSQAVRCVRDAY